MRRTAVTVGLWLVAICGGCAHARSRSAEPQDDPTPEPAVTRLRQENAALKRRVQMLEDRVLKLEHTTAPTATDGRDLPVVRLEAESTPTEAPRRFRSGRTPRAHAASPAPGSRSIKLDPLPHSGAPLGDPPGHEPPSWAPDADAWPEDPHDAARSYRLVGSRLVELTKSKAPTRPDRPKRDAKGRGILAQYEAAMATYKSGDFVQAQEAFDAFARRHIDHDYADNALYWKGESAYDQHHYADALAAFTEVVERYGGGNKAPDALLKIGLCYQRLGDTANARDVLSQLVAAYPSARASDIARARLVELGS